MEREAYGAFSEYNIQMCHFHQKRIVQRYITRKAKLKASKDFLAEKTTNEETGKSRFKHARLISAYRGLRANMPYLFTYKKHKHLSIQNTTNSLDGGVFSPMKILIKSIED